MPTRAHRMHTGDGDLRSIPFGFRPRAGPWRPWTCRAVNICECYPQDCCVEFPPEWCLPDGPVNCDVDRDGVRDRGPVCEGDDNCSRVFNPAQTDTDDDGYGDACDADIDGDHIWNDRDNCPFIDNYAQTDTNTNGVGDACEPEGDTDRDGIPDSADNCPGVYNPSQGDIDWDGIGDPCDIDRDNDGRLNAVDNCPTVWNPDQADFDSDGYGDACDLDIDGDGLWNYEDDCDYIPLNPCPQGDQDEDGVANAEDNCLTVPNTDQYDYDSDGIGDACDDDFDGDGVANDADNCPGLYNPLQADSDGDGYGDECDRSPTDDDCSLVFDRCCGVEDCETCGPGECPVCNSDTYVGINWDPVCGLPEPGWPGGEMMGCVSCEYCAAPCNADCRDLAAKCDPYKHCFDDRPDLRAVYCDGPCAGDPCGELCESVPAKCLAGCPGYENDPCCSDPCCVAPCSAACHDPAAKCAAGCEGYGETDPCCSGTRSGDPCCDVATVCTELCTDWQEKCNAKCVPEHCCPNPDPCDPLCGGGPCNPACTDCDDANPCTIDTCEDGVCDHADRCPPDSDPCDEECCVNGECRDDRYAQPSSADLTDGAGCPDSDVTITATICNTGTCEESYTWQVSKIDGLAEVTISPASGALGLDPGTCGQIPITVSIDEDADAGDTAIIELEVTSTSDGACGPLIVLTSRDSATITVIVVDLDVDSDNDGDIDNDDDAIEDLAFTPQTPGKYGWINNDDSNNDQTNDTDNDVIDGEDDLKDIGELIARPVDASSLVDPHLYLEIGDSSRVRIFETRSPGAVAILGPGLPSTVEVTDAMNGRTFGMEGVDSGTTTIRLVLKEGQDEICSDEVRVTVVAIDMVEWDEFADYSTPLDACPNNGGRRIFPDACCTYDPFHSTRNKVALIATVTPVVDGYPVQFRSWDVDDPFDQNHLPTEIRNLAEIDNDVSGPDNYIPQGGSDPGIAQWSADTGSTGKARVDLHVSTQPGNNYRAGVSAMSDGLDDDHIRQSDVDANQSAPPIQLSEMLTVWRRVWIELDSMNEGSDISYEGTIDAIQNNTPHTGDGRVELNVTDIDDEGRFEGGRMTVSNTNNVYEIIDNVDASWNDYYFLGTPVAAQDLGNNATIVDDDMTELPRLPDANLVVLNAKYKYCYVKFELASLTNSDLNTGLLATMPYSQEQIISKCGEKQDLHPAPDFWTVLLLSGYQSYGEFDDPGENRSSVDLDPDWWFHVHGPHPTHTAFKPGDLAGVYAVTPVSTVPVPNFTIIYQEAIRDYVAQVNIDPDFFSGHERPQTIEYVETHIIAHEIAHQFGIVAHTSGSLVNEWTSFDNELFGEQIRYIRNSQKLGEE